MSNHKHTNALIHETSPYLLQHAHNPVNWQAWNENTLTQARKENKLILVSIGYATCHWCHVMEAESFENEAVAKIMNEHFICIKVDREERPDIDQIYMDAVQLLTGRGGWPLHSITLPDGRPFWGGTYYPRDNWMSILSEINRIWQQEPEKILEYAENLTQGIRQKDYVPFQSEIKSIQPHIFTPILLPWKERFDHEWGGMNRPPKFPLPNNYHFLLRIAVQNADAKLLDFVNLTLQKMAFGGIYDHIRGGFARYSTDHKWHVPHFEKMLYDNAQLVSLYSEAYLITENPLYKETVFNTLHFIEAELYDATTGGFYSALDADSINPEGVKEEGAFYIWTEKELKEILPSEFDLFVRYYNINTLGHWEKGHYVLIKNQSDVDFCFENNLDLETFQVLKQTWHSKLRKVQDQRPKPFLDDKILTSWNALMLKGYCDAYRVFNQPNYLEIAQKNIRFLISRMLRPDGGLNRNFNPNNPESKSKINAYLEDYATLIDALISLHEVTLEEKYLHLAKTFTDYTLEHFYDSDTGFFFFTSDEDVELVHRKIDVPDDVIPSGNSIMARNLFKLSHLFGNAHYEKVSRQMLNNVLEHMHTYASSYSNWLFLASDLASEYYEIVISGKDAVSKLKELNSVYIPNKLITGSVENSTMPLMEQRYNSEKTSIFVCVNKSCLLPSEQVLEAIKPIKIQF
jgi:uncharacterized protein